MFAVGVPISIGEASEASFRLGLTTHYLSRAVPHAATTV
jgi:hypothetical protein